MELVTHKTNPEQIVLTDSIWLREVYSSPEIKGESDKENCEIS